MSRIMIKLFHFLGGLPFAFFLIFTAALLAAYGSLVASIYYSPPFKALLIGFFINILFAALRRWPFKKRHIGFLTTHLGLLAIIAALFLKSQIGLQAVIPLDLHKKERKAYNPEKLSIYLKDRNGKESYHPVDKQFLYDSTLFTPKKNYNNSEAKLHFWHDNEKATVLGLGAIPFFDNIADAEPLRSGLWKIYASKKELPRTPYTVIIGEKTISACLADGTLVSQDLLPDQARLFTLNEGWDGYATVFPLPLYPEEVSGALWVSSSHSYDFDPLSLTPGERNGYYHTAKLFQKWQEGCCDLEAVISKIRPPFPLKKEGQTSQEYLQSLSRTLIPLLSFKKSPPFSKEDASLMFSLLAQLQPQKRELFGPIFIDIIPKEGRDKRALELEVNGKTYRLQEEVAPLPIEGFLLRLTPAVTELPFSLTLTKSWKEGDIAHVLVAGPETLHITTQKGASCEDYHFFLSFWDDNHISLIVSRDPLGYKLLLTGIGLISMGVIMLLGIKR